MASSGTGRKVRPTRFAHLEGFTDICYSDDGKFIITCGVDGDIRLFEGLDDDDCKSHTVSQHAHCLAYKDSCILVGTDLNMVQSFTQDEGKPNGIITRFTSYPTHIQVSKTKNLVAIASSDMTVKVHDGENFRDITFSGHEAAVLSVALDPKGDFLASSSCDGTVRVWNFRTQTVVRSFPLLPKCNDFSFSTTLCRLSWTPDGQYLIIPVGSELHVYNRSSWKVEFKLNHTSITSTTSVTSISPCGSFVAVGCRDGRITVWELSKKMCIMSEMSTSKNMTITGLAWNPGKEDELAFVNVSGELGTVENVTIGNLSTQTEVDSEVNKDKHHADVFPPDNLDTFNDDMEDDDNDISIAKIKSQLGFADDEEGTFLGLPQKTYENEDSNSRAPSRAEAPISAPIVIAPKLPEPQKPFQPGMAPEHLNDRYMIWNNTGIVCQYRTDEENSIEVEFHDSSIHHPLHLNNILGHSMAALNSQALALAAESQDDQLSKLAVHHFSAWDGSKEWQTDMPEGEDILAVGIGSGWVAVGTDCRNLRIFTITGVQRDIISVPGPVVCVTGFEDIVMVIFHSGIGVCGEQCMSIMVLKTSGKKHLIPIPIPVPLSPNSFLAWAGFTDEGTPAIMDSVGVVRLFNNKMGYSWTSILNTKAHAKGKSDNYFTIGVSEIQGVVRCILCKGSRYPPVLPRPHVSLLEWKIPLCENESEKSSLEEKMIRTKLLMGTVDKLNHQGFDVEVPTSETNKALKESMIKLFALACRSDKESRGLEICELMPSVEMVEVAIKYAAKLHRMQLAERLNELIVKKMQESVLPVYDDDDDEDDTEMLMRSRVSNKYSIRDQLENEPSDGQMLSRSSSPGIHQVEEEKEDQIKNNPLLAAATKSSKENSALERLSLTPSSRNPFKKTPTSLGATKGIEVLDTLKKPQKENNSPVLRPFIRKPKAKVEISSTKLFNVNKESNSLPQLDGKENLIVRAGSPKMENIVPKGSPIVKKASALKLWLDDNKSLVKEKFPTASETELLVKAALLFKDIEDSVKQKYKNLASSKSQNSAIQEQSDKNKEVAIKTLDSTEDRKRKMDSEKIEPVEKKKCSSKLSAFAFTKKDN